MFKFELHNWDSLSFDVIKDGCSVAYIIPEKKQYFVDSETWEMNKLNDLLGKASVVVILTESEIQQMLVEFYATYPEYSGCKLTKSEIPYRRMATYIFWKYYSGLE